MAHVAVIGGGITGMATALFLARRAHRVTVIEQEQSQALQPVADDFRDGRRPRVPQAIQPHALLGPARTVLLNRAPDVYADMRRLGAWEQHEFDWFGRHPPRRAGDEQLVLVRTRRIVLERALRTALHAQEGVDVRSGTAVRGLVHGPGRDGVPRVTGVSCAEGPVTADLVVDAGGRRSPVPGWLTVLGARPPAAERHRVGLAYACRWYRMPPGRLAPTVRAPYSSAARYALAIAFPSDNDLLGVALVCRTDDPTLPALRDPQVFDELARMFPSTHAWLSARPRPVGGVHVMAGLDNQWTPTADSNGPVVTGLIRAGDALVHTNPTLTQGMSLALWGAERIASTAHTAADHPSYARAYDDWARHTLKPWYDLQVAADRDNQTRLSGAAAAPSGMEARLRAARFPCALEDPIVMRAWAQARHLFRTPEQAFGTDEVRHRLERWLAARGGVLPGPTGPARERWEAAVAASGVR
ncbi:FAD-dependent oxidoreductase [Streptomyces olivaceoviridis]|uniref:FAD-dependent oxidoreductase n=1 Tax=Streptomyces olivaceoviridis TaxID=1921 RepID=UPI0036B3CC4F